MSRSAAILESGAPLVVASTEPRALEPGRVRVQVVASGMCNADLGTVAADKPEYGFPLVPGHEVAGLIAAFGARVSGWQLGDRVVEERYPLNEAAVALEHLRAGAARFRVVLETGSAAR